MLDGLKTLYKVFEPLLKAILFVIDIAVKGTLNVLCCLKSCNGRFSIFCEVFMASIRFISDYDNGNIYR